MLQEHLKSTLIIILFWSLSVFLGCASAPERKAGSPFKLLQKAKYLFKKDKTEKAKEAIQFIMEDFPDSKERIAGLMLLGDLHYKNEEYEESKFQYQKFTELYPAHKFVDRAYFYKAMSNFKLTDLASRDLNPVKSALEDFRSFINRTS